MKKFTAVGCLLLLPAAAACDNGSGGHSTGSNDSGLTPNGTGGGTPGTDAPTGMPTVGTPVQLIPDATGWVDGQGNTVGIQGAWYAYDDCTNSPANCTKNHTPAAGSFDNTGGKMCTKGTTVAVMAQADFSTQWGAGIALDLNNSGGTNGQKMPYNAQTNNVIGFSLTVTGTAPGLRINITSVPAGDNAHFVTATVPGDNTVLFSKAKQGSWVTSKIPLDTTQLLAIQFQIPTVMSKAVDFDFCIENLAALTN
jgi:hypothetical protein